MRAPVLAVGDGALGFWAALREVFPETRTQRCWFHKIANVLGALPKSAHPGAKKALADMTSGQVLKIIATDPGSVRDFQAFAKQTGNELLGQNTVGKEFIHFLKRR